ncbi:hypothetical protein ACQY0O_001065 [Thecaphora frezii]
MSQHSHTLHHAGAPAASERGILSPPLSGRACKSDDPRVPSAGLASHHPVGGYGAPMRVDIDDLVSAPSNGHRQQQQQQQQQRAGTGGGTLEGAFVAISPGKKRGSSMSKAEDRMLTPPLSRDTRMDGGKLDPPSARLMSDGELDPHNHHQQSGQGPSTAKAAHGDKRWNKADEAERRRRGPVESADSDVEENPFLDEPMTVAVPMPRCSYVEPEDVDEQDGLGAEEVEEEEEEEELVDEEDLESDGDTSMTPRPLRLARPTRDHVPVDSQDVSSLRPIRDTPMNPFLEGGPADVGFEGPRAYQARVRASRFPGKERGKITYVFRGQRVTYADPEYDSDDSDEAAPHPHHRTRQRPSRLQPKLLFPPASSSSRGTGLASSSFLSVPSSSSASLSSRLAAAAAVGASTPQNQAGPSRSRGGGLFAAETAARETAAAAAKKRMTALQGWSNEASARLQAMTGGHVEREREARAVSHAFTRPIQSSVRIAHHRTHAHVQYRAAPSTATNRSASLTKLEEAAWSEDEEEPPLRHHHHHHPQQQSHYGGNGTTQPPAELAVVRASKRTRLAEEEEGSSHRYVVDDVDMDADADGEDDLDYLQGRTRCGADARGVDGFGGPLLPPPGYADPAQGALMAALQDEREVLPSNREGRGLAQRMKRKYR